MQCKTVKNSTHNNLINCFFKGTFIIFLLVFRSIIIRNYLSPDPLAKYFPSGENATILTQALCPSNVWTLVFASKFHNLIVLKRKNKFGMTVNEYKAVTILNS